MLIDAPRLTSFPSAAAAAVNSVPQPAAGPDAGSGAGAVAGSTAASVGDSTAGLIADPAAGLVADPAAGLVAGSNPGSVAESAAGLVARSLAESAAKPVADPAAGRSPELDAEPTTEPSHEPTPRPSRAEATPPSPRPKRSAEPPLAEELGDWFRQRAAAVDDGSASAHQGLSFLAQRHLLALGVPHSAGGDGGTLQQATELIAAVAEQCMTSAFVLWSHRALIGLIAGSDEPHRHRPLLESLKRGRTFGATGLADAVRHAAGMGRLRVEAVSRDGHSRRGADSDKLESGAMGGEVGIGVAAGIPAGAEAATRTPAGARPGTEAGATGSKATPGPLKQKAESPNEARRILRGFVPWATNLVDRRFLIAVAAAKGAGGQGPEQRGDGGRGPRPDRADFFVAVVPGDALGLRVHPAPRLLALGGSASGSVQLDGVPLEETRLLAADGAAFLARIRPSFLLLQCGLPWGIGAAALAAVLSVPLVGDKAALASRRDRLIHRFNRLVADVRRLAQTVFSGEDGSSTGGGDGHSLIYAIMRTRKQLSEVAMHAVQLELEAQGGAGYAAGSPTARRWREAAFLPLQTPTLAQLQSQLDGMKE